MKMSEKEREFHRRIATHCFNGTWDLLDKKDRTNEENIQMLYLAHASRFHWGLVGTPTNRAVGEWQISKVYAELGHTQLALEFAKTCLTSCEENELADIAHTADEAMARAYAVAKDYHNARRYLSSARKRLDRLSLSERDRDVYMDQIRQTEALILE
jgi:hypothetical protein